MGIVGKLEFLPETMVMVVHIVQRLNVRLFLNRLYFTM